MARVIFLVLVIVSALYVFAVMNLPWLGWFLPVLVALWVLALVDSLQSSHAILRNFPLLGHFRYLFEAVRPEINQYFIESNTDGRPFSREQRSVVYQRAKGELDTLPFGTQRKVEDVGYEWIAHSISARTASHDVPRIRVGSSKCTQPYESSLLNVSAMSYGSLSQNAIAALNIGAREGAFAHNTGEGGISPYHQQGGDLIWQIGTGYFGCRGADGGFDIEQFTKRAADDAVKMIEIKLSQGAKPGHGGILPAGKVTPEISEIRGVPMGKDVLSPPTHRAFSTPIELLEFVSGLRDASGGKPVGIKLCVGQPKQVIALALAMRHTGTVPDFICIDGGEGGTGAAPLEFSNAIGMPLLDGLALVHSVLKGFSLRDEIKIVASGRIVTGFDMVVRLASGADLCNSARAMMFALGCIQALRCNSNHCPTGVATQDPALVRGLVVADKAPRVARYQQTTLQSLMELLGAAGLEHPDQLRPEHIHRRISATQVRTYADIYPWLEDGELLGARVPNMYAGLLKDARPDAF